MPRLLFGGQGPVHLYHGSPTTSGLYLFDDLQALAEEHANLRVTGSVLTRDTARAGVRQAPLDDAIFDDFPSLEGARVYLCGHPDLVKQLRKRAFLAGADLAHIHADPFAPSAPPQAA